MFNWIHDLYIGYLDLKVRILRVPFWVYVLIFILIASLRINHLID